LMPRCRLHGAKDDHVIEIRTHQPAYRSLGENRGALASGLVADEEDGAQAIATFGLAQTNVALAMAERSLR